MKRIKLFILIFLLVVFLAQKSVAMNLANFLPRQINGWKALKPDQYYDNKTIFDYIDGSGEVYNSYNFKKLLVREYKKSKLIIVVDLFDMGSPEDAYGIFSHDYENQGLGIGQCSFYLEGSLTFWKSQYFVSIWAEQETEEIKNTIFNLAKSISRAIPETGPFPELIKFLPPKNLRKEKIRFFHNHYSLNYHYFLAEDNILNLNKNTDAVLGEYKLNNSRSFILIIKFPSKNEAEKAIKSFINNYLPEGEKKFLVQIENKKWISFGIESNFVFILFDIPDKNLAFKLAEEIKNNIKESL